MRAIGTRLGRLEHVAGVTTETYAQMHLRAVREAARRNAVETQVTRPGICTSAIESITRSARGGFR